MPKLVNRNPKYRKHRASGQAIVTVNGHDIYLGPYGTAASRREYDRVVCEWLQNGRRSPFDNAADLSVVELIAAYGRYARDYYKPAPGCSDGERDGIRLAAAAVKRLYADTLVTDFGPLALKVVREAMIANGWARTYVNAQIGRVRRLFKWGVENELVPPSILHGLQAVSGLRRGKTEAAERDPVQPVSDHVVQATLPHLSLHVRAMVRLQLLTGMRAGEVVVMRTGEIDRSETTWKYRPGSHKNLHRGHERVVYLGPQAQQLLTPLLRLDPDAFIFSPADADADRREARHSARATPASCGNVPGTNRARRPRRRPGVRYDVDAYRRAIARACDYAFPPPADLARQRVPARGRKGRQATRWESAAEWKARVGPEKWATLRRWQADHRWSPLQLRHSAATRLRRDYGLEAAQVLLGHKTLTVTQVYAAKNVEAAQRVMSEAG